jgi:hypothetical protein
MSDLIQNAIQKASANAKGSIPNSINSNQIAAAKDASKKLEELPLKKDPQLLKQQIKAEASKKKSKADQLLQTGKQVALEQSKLILKQLAKKALASLKLPVIDPKILHTVILAKQKKQEMKQRQEQSRENLKKNRELFKFPMKKSLAVPTLPEVPDIPKIPDAKELTSKVKSAVDISK